MAALASGSARYTPMSFSFVYTIQFHHVPQQKYLFHTLPLFFFHFGVPIILRKNLAMPEWSETRKIHLIA